MRNYTFSISVLMAKVDSQSNIDNAIRESDLVPHWYKKLHLYNNLDSLWFLFPFAVLPATVDRLGDSKDAVRESAQDLLQNLMSPATTPQVRTTRGHTHYTRFIPYWGFDLTNLQLPIAIFSATQSCWTFPQSIEV